MSTRSITEIRSSWTPEDDKSWETLATIYRHSDGYLEGHGRWLCDFLSNIKVTNGRVNGSWRKYANGPGELASAIVSAMTEEDLHPSLEPAGAIMGQEYHYQINVAFSIDGGEVSITVFDGPVTFFGSGGEDCTNQIFCGSVQEFSEFITPEPVEPCVLIVKRKIGKNSYIAMARHADIEYRLKRVNRELDAKFQCKTFVKNSLKNGFTNYLGIYGPENTDKGTKRRLKSTLKTAF